jgi:sugar phosphate isomerase/epimerase
MSDKDKVLYTRRDFGKLTLAGLPMALAVQDLHAFAAVDSKIKGVQIGAITYSFRSFPNPADIITAYETIGLSEMELMANHAEMLAGAPIPPPAAGGRGRGATAPPPPPAAPVAPAPPAPGAAGSSAQPPAAPETPAAAAPPAGRRGGGRRVLTPEEQAEADARAEALRKWRMSATAATFAPVRKRITDAGIDLRVLCFNMNVNTTKDDELEYAFMMAKALGVRAISTSTQVSMAKRTAPFAEKHKVLLAFHNHANLTNPDETATPESFATILAASKYHAINLDIGHFTAANFDPVAYIQQHHGRITHLHLKDRKKDNGANVPWGQGDTPLKPVLKLLEKNKWDIPGNVEFEYEGDPVVEVGKCLQYCREALA